MNPAPPFARGVLAVRAASTSKIGISEMRQFFSPSSSSVRFMALATVDAESERSMAIDFGLSPSNTRSIMRKPRPRDGQRGARRGAGSTIR